MRNTFYIIAILIVLVVGFFAFNNYIYNQKQGDGAALTDYRQIRYVIKGQAITIGASNSIESIRYFGNEALGDVNGDGISDIAFLATETRVDGKTDFYLLAALKKSDDTYEGTQGVLIGTEIAPQNTSISDSGIVLVNYAIKSPDTDVSVGKTLRLKLNTIDQSFGEVVVDFEGEADPSVMTLTMKPWTWVSARRGDDALIAPRNPDRFVLTFKADGSFSATTDCNSMGGSYTASGTALTFGQMFSTKMFCEDSQEQIFADVLRDVESYKFTGKGELIMRVKVEGEAVFR